MINECMLVEIASWEYVK